MTEASKMLEKRAFGWVLLTVILFTLTMVFAPIASAASSDNVENTDAFDAIGIDASTPEDVDLTSTDNPYGSERMNILPVYELFEGSVNSGDNKQDAKLYGHDEQMLVDQNTFYSSQGVSADSNTELTPGAYYAYSSDAGDFIGSGQDDMVVTVAAGKWDSSSADGATKKGAHAGVYLYVTNPVTGDTSTVKTLLNTSSFIGNIGRYNEEDFTEAPYQLQNYLQVETGDFDGDGIDEIAVYVPQGGGGSATSNSRVEIYKLSYTNEDTPGDNYLDMAKWEKAWTYYFYEGYYVSNMVSLLAGDFNRDGTDDLAMTWGVYYSSDYKNNSKAVILYGDNKNEMLQKDKWFDLSYGNSQIVRAAFTCGDVNGDDTDEVILGGQSEDDINNGHMYTRVINMYTYNGDLDSFLPYSSDNFSLVQCEDEEGNLIDLGDGKYYSSPAMVANISAVRFGGKGTDYYIYLDSVLYAYGNDGLEIYDMLDDDQDGGKLSTFYNNSRLEKVTSPTPAQREMARYYVEYGALSGDFTGDSKENLHVGQYFLLQEFRTSWTETIWTKIYKRFWWFKVCSWWQPTAVTYTENNTIKADFDVYAFYANTDEKGTITGMNTKKLYDGGTKLDKYYCLVNTDKDTSFMKYTHNHYVAYTDPEVLAVIASAPYYEDVANMEGGDDHVGNSETSYSSSSGSEQSSSKSNTISAGSYFGIDHDFNAPLTGIKISSFEMETEYSHGWTWETEQSSSLEQTITYGTSAGEDAVAFYSIPMEVYEYTLYVPADNGYEEQTMTVNIPHTAAVSVLSLGKYESIAADYPELPQISGTVLTHEIGDPSTYPSSENGYRNAVVYNGNWAAVGYGNGYIAQEIAMGTGTTKSYSQTNSFSFKIGGGIGSFKAGVTVGSEWGKGSATTTTEGSTFAGTIVNMPAEAEDYGYYYAWKLFTYEYSDGTSAFPVVNYLVTDVTAPPTVPTDFDWDIETTTDESVDLTWTYSGNASEFVIYREYDFSGSTGMVEIARLAASDSEAYDEASNSRKYRYTVGGLSAYQEYKFQIQVVGTSQPTTSAPGVILKSQTKTDVGYPDLALSSTELLVYPDAVGTVTLDVSYEGSKQSADNENNPYNAVLYQWQKFINGQWTDAASTSDYTSSAMSIRNAGMSTEGEYRCEVKAIYYDSQRGAEYRIIAYSEPVSVRYSKRSSRVKDSISADDNVDVSKPTLAVDIENTHGDSAAAPTGTVTFFIKGVDYVKSYDVQLTSAEGQTYSTAIVDSDSISALADGIYEITAYYAGSRIFRSCESESIMYKAGNSDGYWLEVSESAVYGDEITPALYLVTGSGTGATKTPVTEGISYAVNNDLGWVNDSAITAKAVGTYTITARVNGTVVASKKITVSPYQLSIAAPSYTHTANTDMVEHPAVSALKAYKTGTSNLISLPNGDTLEGLGFYVRAINSAFKEGTILKYDPDSTEEPGGDPSYGKLWFYSPGKYMLVAAADSSADTTKLSNYDISCVPGTYILTAATYPVVPKAILLNGQVRGTVELTSPEGFVTGTEYQNGTQMTFKATPYDGYEVKAWYIASSEEDLSTSTAYQLAGSNYTGMYLNYKMNSEPLYIAVEFQVAQRSLTFGANNEEFGTVSCDSSPYMTSGAIFAAGTSYTFTASPADGYHFLNWVVSGAESFTDTIKETISVTGGKTSITLRAVFERDSYVLTLNGDLQAYYFDDTDNNSDTPEEKVVVLTGAAIPGDKSVVVEPKSGYSIESWTDLECSEQTYSFTIGADTVITALTYYNGYEVLLDTTQASNGESTVSVNKDISASISGGTEIVFEAKPVYGSRFAGWKINGADDYLTASAEDISLSADGRTMTIDAIGENYEIEAIFENNDAYSLELDKAAYGAMEILVSNPSYGTVENPVYNYDNEAVSTVLTVYKRDVLQLNTKVADGFRVIYWKEDDTTTQTDLSSWTISDIQNDKSIAVDFSSIGFYAVTYATEGNGSFSSTTIDGVSFASGNQSMGAGKNISFAAEPDSGYMIDHWTKNGSTVLNSYKEPLVDKEYSFVLGRNTDVKAVFSSLVTNTINMSGENATMKVTEAAPTDYATGDANDGYTSVRNGAAIVLRVSPDDHYRIEAVSAQGSDEISFDSVTKNDDGSWICTINSVKEDITVSVTTVKLYEITQGTFEKGTVNITPEIAAAGDMVSISANASSDYKFSEWIVTDEAGNNVSLDNEGQASTTFIMPVGNVTVTPSFVKIYKTLLGEFRGGTVSIEPSVVVAGDTVKITASTSRGYKFSKWTVVDEAGNNLSLDDETQESTTFIMPAGDVTITPSFARKKSSAGIGGGGAAVAPAEEENPVDAAVDEAQPNEDGKTVARVEVQSSNDEGIYEQDIPKDFFDNKDKILEVVSPEGTVALPDDIFDEVPGKDVQISIEQVDAQSLDLPAKAIKEIGNKPVIDINLAIGGKKTKWKSDDKEITVSIPYTLTKEEKADPHKVIAVYIDDDGNITPLTQSDYDSAKGVIVFNTKHTSYYSVQYVDKNFEDLANYSWAEESIEALAARGVINGISEREFAPQANIKRADFVVLVTKILGLQADAGSNFSDVEAGSYYYEAVGIAKEMGIVSGAGDNKFKPQEAISRQDMMVILNRALKITGENSKLTADNGKKASDFDDSQQVASYAKDSVDYLISKGIVSGDGNNINPADNTKRAEVAALLYKLLGQLK